MKLSIMQPYLFPYIGYFQLIAASDLFILYDDVNFINRGWINRNRILINNKESYFTIPLSKSSQNKLIKDICVTEPKKWKEKLIKQFHYTYAKAPYFDSFFPHLKTVFDINSLQISDYSVKSIEVVLNYLSINKEIKQSSSENLCTQKKGSSRIRCICEHYKAKTYVNLPGAASIYINEIKTFKSMNINLGILQFPDIKYNQFGNKFVPHLSIIDLLMFNSIEKSKQLVKNFDVIYYE